jgi:uncharacterized protein
MTQESRLPSPGRSARTRVRRLPDKGVTDAGQLERILDAGLVAHVGIADADGQPYVLPVGFGRDGDRLLFHGSSASRLFRTLADGARACVTVTVVDGLVLARSAFESSMSYRCVMALGRCTVVHGDDKLAALECIGEHLMPGRWIEVRKPTHNELRATIVLALALDETSVKLSAGGPDDAAEDLDLEVWAGVVPLAHTWGVPVPAHDLRFDLPVPRYVREWRGGRT